MGTFILLVSLFQSLIFFSSHDSDPYLNIVSNKLIQKEGLYFDVWNAHPEPTTISVEKTEIKNEKVRSFQQNDIAMSVNLCQFGFSGVHLCKPSMGINVPMLRQSLAAKPFGEKEGTLLKLIEQAEAIHMQKTTSGSIAIEVLTMITMRRLHD